MSRYVEPTIFTYTRQKMERLLEREECQVVKRVPCLYTYDCRHTWLEKRLLRKGNCGNSMLVYAGV